MANKVSDIKGIAGDCNYSKLLSDGLGSFFWDSCMYARGRKRTKPEEIIQLDVKETRSEH